MQTTVKERPIIFSGPMVVATVDDRKNQTRRFLDSVLGVGRVTEFQPSKTLGYDWIMRDKRMCWNDFTNEELLERCPYGQVGDVLWIRETYRYGECDFEPKMPNRIPTKKGMSYVPIMTDSYGMENGEGYVEYLADGQRVSFKNWEHNHEILEHCIGRFNRKIPSIHMPKWASRIKLLIKDVRVERVQDATYDDIKAEGWPGPINNRNRDQVVHSDASRDWWMDLWESINGKFKGRDWASNPFVWVVEFEGMAL